MVISILIETEWLLLIKMLAPFAGGGGLFFFATYKILVAYIRRNENKTINLKEGVIQGYSATEVADLAKKLSVKSNARRSSVPRIRKS